MNNYLALPSIDLNIAEKMRDKEYRSRFFLLEASAAIARQLVGLRKLRGMNQRELADRAGMQQSAVSRAERADYHNWSFNTLRRLAEAVDARLRIVIEPWEDVASEYETTQSAHWGGATLGDDGDEAMAFLPAQRRTSAMLAESAAPLSTATIGLPHQLYPPRKRLNEIERHGIQSF